MLLIRQQIDSERNYTPPGARSNPDLMVYPVLAEVP